MCQSGRFTIPNGKRKAPREGPSIDLLDERDRERVCPAALLWRSAFVLVVVRGLDRQRLRQRVDGDEPRTTVVCYSARKAHPGLCPRDRPFGNLVNTFFHATRRGRNDRNLVRVQLETLGNPQRKEIGAKFDFFSACSKVWTERYGIGPGRWKGGDERLQVVRVVRNMRIDVSWLTVGPARMGLRERMRAIALR